MEPKSQIGAIQKKKTTMDVVSKPSEKVSELPQEGKLPQEEKPGSSGQESQEDGEAFTSVLHSQEAKLPQEEEGGSSGIESQEDDASSTSDKLQQEEELGSSGQESEDDDEAFTSVPLRSADYQCDKCGRTFRQLRTLMEHIDAVHKGIKYTCEICGSSMKWKTNLAVHMAQVHNITENQKRKPKFRRKCQKCKFKFSSNELLYKHLKVVHNVKKPVSCPVCPEKFETTAILRTQHKFAHPQLVPYRCDVCKLRYASKAGLQSHIESSEHQQTNANYPLHTEFDELDRVCYICSKTFNSYGAFHVHLCEHNRSERKDESQTCKECLETFTSKYQLTSHLLKEHQIFASIPPNAEKVVVKHNKDGSKPALKCTVCSKVYRCVESFRYHLRLHKGEPMVKCDTCGYTTFVKGDMRKHIRIHTGEKPLKCPTCNKMYSSYSARKRCMLIHTGIKSHKCTFCPKSFFTSPERRRHEKSCPSRDSKGVLNYKCEVCGKMYESAHGIYYHKKTQHTSNHNKSPKASRLKHTKPKQPLPRRRGRKDTLPQQTEPNPPLPKIVFL